MADRLHIDIEVFSECDLKEKGLYPYAEHPSTEVTVCNYAFDDSPIHIWLPYDLWDLHPSVIPGIKARPEYDGGVIHTGLQAPGDLQAHIAQHFPVAAHNAQFERIVMNAIRDKYELPWISIEQTVCTMAKARAHGLPGSLEDVANALGTHKKMATGRQDMLAFAKPRKKEAEPRWTPANDPERFIRLVAYCIDDVKAERGIDKVIPDLPASEVEVYRMDQRMNDRGVAVDHENRAHAQFLVDAYRKELTDRCVALTGGIQPTQREKIATWVKANGWPHLTDMQADTVAKLTKRSDVPEKARKMLQLYSTVGMKAVAKFDVIEQMAAADGRLHGMFQYHGAGTGRWSSMGVQLQNLLRPVIENANDAIPLFKYRNVDIIRDFYDVDPMKVIASTIRGMLVASEGKELVAIDYSGIEARIIAWVAGETWKLKAFEQQDAGLGPDNYKLAYSRVFQVPVASVNKEQRQIGKPIDLSMGFEGGVGAFVTMSATYGVDLDELTKQSWGKINEKAMESAEWMWGEGYLRGHQLPERTVILCDAIKWAWRMAHPATVACWKQLKDAAIDAVRHPGQAFTTDTGLIRFIVEGQWLYLRLPSGRRIAYYKPTVEEGARGPALYYMGVDTETRRWMKTSMYGGKQMQHIAEGVGRDLLVNGMQQLEVNRVPMVMCIHDEAVGEQEIGTLTLETAMKLFLNRPTWAKGLPLAAEGFIEKRYRK